MFFAGLDGSPDVEPKWVRDGMLSGHHDMTIFTADWSPAHGTIVTGGADDSMKLFVEDKESTGVELSDANDASSFVLAQDIPSAHAGDVNCVRWNPTDLTLLASVGDDNIVKLWRLE